MIPGILTSIYFWNKLKSNIIQTTYIVTCIGSMYYHIIKGSAGYSEFAHSVDLICQQMWICAACFVNPYQGVIFFPWYGWFFAIVNQYVRPLTHTGKKCIAHAINGLGVVCAIYPNGDLQTWMILYGCAFACFAISYIKVGPCNFSFLHSIFHIIIHVGCAYYCLILMQL